MKSTDWKSLFSSAVLRLVTGSLACVASPVSTAAESVARRPNILMVAVDDLKPTIGAFGDVYAITPHMDRLATRGTAFLNAHCQQAVCGPARASLLTGLRPDTVRIWDLATRMRDTVPDLVTLPQHFRQNGYYTASFGKIFDARCCDGWATNDVPSWSQPHTNPDTPHLVYGTYGTPAVEVATKRRWNAARDRGDDARDERMFKPIDECLDHDVPDNFYNDGICADRAIEFLRRAGRDDAPFFLAVGFIKPHLPFVAPRKYWDLYDPTALPLATIQGMPAGAPAYHFQDSLELRNGYAPVAAGPLPEDLQRRLVHGYYACVSYTDAQIGRLIEALEEEGLADNTIIVLWGDHGWHLGDHGMWCKHTNYEQATRAPLIVVDPRRTGGGSRVTRPVEFLDIAPTLVELAGIPARASFEGRSMEPLLVDGRAPFKRFAVSQYPRGPEGMEGGQNLMGYAFRDERHRFIVWIEKDFRAGERDGRCVALELYDYVTDPLETRNLAIDPGFAVLTRGLERDAAEFAARELRMQWSHSP